MENESKDIQISVVIISKNEEKNIRRCIESVLEALKYENRYEIILVDSNSTDNTVGIASEYPLTIIQLTPYSHHSPAAGRYVGFLHSNGDFVQFVDGDMTLHKDWFRNSLSFFSDRNLAGVAGITVNYFMERGIQTQTMNHKVQSPEKVTVLKGAALFRNLSLQRTGAYNPHIYGNEEAELCFRLCNAGYELIYIPYEMASHYSRTVPLAKELKIRIKRKYYLGCGQTLRYSIDNPRLFVKHLGYFRLYLAYSLWIILGLLSAGLTVLSTYWVFYSWLACSIVFYVIYSYKKRSATILCHKVISWTLFGLGIFIGFLFPLRKRKLDYITIKKHRT